MPFFGLAKSVGFCGIPWHSPWRVCWGIPQAIKEIESSVMALLEREGLGTFMDKKAIRLVTGWPQNWSTWMMINRKSNGLGCILGNHASAARGWKEKTFRGWIPLHAFWCSDSLKFWKAQHMSKHQTAPKSPKACNRGGPYGPYGGGSLIWYFRLHTSRLHSSCPPTRFWSLKPGKPVSWRWVQSVSASWPVIYLWWTVQTNVQALSWLLKEQLTWDSDFQACFGALFSKRLDFDTDTDLAPYIWFLHQTSSQFWNQV